MTFPVLKRVAKELYERFKPRKVVIEDKASGTSLIQELKREGMYGVEPYQPPPGSDKEMRTVGQSMKLNRATSCSRQTPLGSMITSENSRGFRAPSSTIRSTRRLRPWTS